MLGGGYTYSASTEVVGLVEKKLIKKGPKHVLRLRNPTVVDEKLGYLNWDEPGV